jgi:hypothetical protein
MVPISMSVERCNQLANDFGCKTESMPYTYLGLPMGTTKPKIEHFIFITERIDKRLSGIATNLSYDGRLIVVKSIIISMLNYAMCTTKVPLTILDHVEESARVFSVQVKKLRREVNAWSNGNKALLMKNIHKFMNREDILWVQLIWNAHYQPYYTPHNIALVGSFWWKDCLSL